MHDKTILFIDDSPTQHFILTQGYFNNHLLAKHANLKSYCSSPDSNEIQEEEKVFAFLEDLEKGMQIDYAVIDYHMPGADGTTMRSMIKHKNPSCKIWMYTGMPYKYIQESDKELFDRIINKDNGVSYLLDSLYQEIKS